MKMLYLVEIASVLSALLLTATSGVRIGQGDKSVDKEWSYIWYENEPFILYCNSSKLAVKDSDYIRWEKPSKDGDTVILKRDHDDGNYKINQYFGVEGFQLEIKKITSGTKGVYVCRVHDNDTGVSRGHTILGINIREQQYDDLFDKYRHHFVVAVIATAVFLVPFATVCITYHFRYERRHGTREKYSPNEMTRYPNGLAEDKGAYENPTFTQDSANQNTQL